MGPLILPVPEFVSMHAKQGCVQGSKFRQMFVQIYVRAHARVYTHRHLWAVGMPLTSLETGQIITERLINFAK